jgi:hypothetical protein
MPVSECKAYGKTVNSTQFYRNLELYGTCLEALPEDEESEHGLA